MKGWRRWLLAAAPLVLLALPACGDGGGASSGGSDADSGETLRLGYSAWPGWFPLAVTDEAGIFDQVGLDVDLRYFTDYLSSLDAMAAGRLDANTQTLNDTMAAVSAGDEQVIVVVNDNSTGNDQIICDESITSIDQLAGKTIAAEAGVVDHFLLLQGLESVGLTEEDIDFRGVLTADAAAAFAGGEFDCVGVFAPFTTTALERPGSHAVFDSSDFPGTIPDHIVVSKEMVEDRPQDVQKLVEAWYLTLDYLAANPEAALDIMAAQAEVTPAEYEEYGAGTTLFSVEQALAAFEEGDDSTSLIFVANLINPFLVESGLTEKEASLDGLFDPSFTRAHADSKATP